MDRSAGDLNQTRTEVLGVPVNAVTMETALDHIRAFLDSDDTHVIAATNPEKVISAQANPELLAALKNASLVIPDGIGVVAAARLLGKGRMQRVPGSDLMPEICGLAAAENKTVFLFGAKQEIVSQAAAILKDRFPGLVVAGTQHGYVEDSDMENALASINAADADILFVGLGSPRQELWMNRYRQRLNVRVCQGVGGTFDAICGHPKRAPKVMRKLNLEWLYRLVTQPQRVHRQLALPRFAARVIRHYFASN